MMHIFVKIIKPVIATLMYSVFVVLKSASGHDVIATQQFAFDQIFFFWIISEKLSYRLTDLVRAVTVFLTGTR